ncbi:UDP binding domain-containing protein [Nocardia sp. NPDC004860]|uniref:UDP binding domain-containing protein n=1 Tax=Nocardia sp. NPDC004860 TaxID=3154557 RepID=UPI0033B7FF93
MSMSAQNARKTQPALDFVTTLVDRCAGADVILVATEWPEFAALRPADISETVRHRRVIDGRNCLDA